MSEMRNIDKTDVRYDKYNDEWIVTLIRQKYVINAVISENKNCDVYLNQQLIVIPKSSRISIVGFDHILEIEGTKIHCVFQDGKFDIAVQGRYIKSEKDYIPIKGLLLFSITGMILLVMTLTLILIDAMTIPICVLLIVLIFVNIAFYDYLEKKAKRE